MIFKEYKISEIGQVVSGGTPKTAIEEYWNGDISWITPKDLSSHDDVYISRGERNISLEGLNNSSAKLMPKNTVLLTSRAPIGYIAIAENELATNQGFKSLICNEDICHFKYFYYWLKLNINYIINNANGSTFKEISGKTFKELTISLPSLDVQKKISNILWSIDEKIGINKKINHNLDSILKNIFNEWFIKFSPFKGSIFKNSELGNIPMDWEIKSLQDISKNIICGKTPSTKNEEYWGDEIPFVTIPDMHNSIYVFNTERYLSKKGSESQIKKLIPPNSICVSCIATAGLVILTSKYCQTNQQINTIICEDNVSPYFIYLYMVNLSKYIQLLGSSGSTTNNLNKKEFSKIKIILPPNKIMKKFSNLVKPLFIKIKKNELEIEKLINLRDLLLPKLMSGEINVSKLK